MLMMDVVQMRGHSFFALGSAPFVVDLGANDGKFTADVLQAYPGATVLMVEADPYLVQKIAERFRTHPGLQLYRGLVGAQTQDAVPFHLSRVPEGNSVRRAFSNHWSPGETREISVPMTTLPDLLAQANPPRIDLLKVDIEGSEWDVLPTLTPREATLVAQLSVEFHDFLDPAARPQTEACIAHLEDLGYTTRCRAAPHVHGSPYFDCHFYR